MLPSVLTGQRRRGGPARLVFIHQSIVAERAVRCQRSSGSGSLAGSCAEHTPPARTEGGPAGQPTASSRCSSIIPDVARGAGFGRRGSRTPAERASLDPHRDRRPHWHHRAYVGSLVDDDAVGPSPRRQGRTVRIRSDRDQPNSVQHCAGIVPGQADHVRHDDLTPACCHRSCGCAGADRSASSSRCCGRRPAVARRSTLNRARTSSERAAGTRALHQHRHARRDRVEHTAYRALYRAHG